ncbi:tRNA uridine(34) 5-carboxymethylaminomethyl modification radical SAM/GNAT enzyme Elp3 [Candidatus Woesearchaeota archaeon]|nr:MAG: tRNA uridine(34) 5-carboxymethylaminomethyl modification radical SAM/GNAT enzyme Elp3 [Candidatus Woesearchaeota archaeon]
MTDKRVKAFAQALYQELTTHTRTKKTLENAFQADKLAPPRLQKLKERLAKQLNLATLPSNATILLNLTPGQAKNAKHVLSTKPVRSISGVNIVAIMTSPARCPHGKCTYCPGGLSSSFGDVPQSYTGREPASQRGARLSYDAYLQVMNRLAQYLIAGHELSKTEVIVMGGTFPSRPVEYQQRFIADAFQALNDFSSLFYDAKGNITISKLKDVFKLPGAFSNKERQRTVIETLKHIQQTSLNTSGLANDLESDKRVAYEHERNERAKVRCVGLTVETRPSPDILEQANLALAYGATRIELGVQTLSENVLAYVHRGHTLEDTKNSLRVLKDLGFKINAHMMLGLPLTTPEEDVRHLKQLFADPHFRPDMLKIYPTLVLKGTHLYQLYQQGHYRPLTTMQAAEIIARAKPHVPRWCRIMRVQRDIPSTLTEEGPSTNLRQVVKSLLAQRGTSCQCIRCREIKDETPTQPRLEVTTYQAQEGTEFFLALNNKPTDKLIGFCRLRFPSQCLRPEITPSTGIIRELHVYGKATPLQKTGDVQHRGFGKTLLQEAERICKANNKTKVLVIAGIGVRSYYAKLGYHKEGPYMAKHLT